MCLETLIYLSVGSSAHRFAPRNRALYHTHTRAGKCLYSLRYNIIIIIKIMMGVMMSIKVRCPICNGSGKVEGNFGGSCGRYDEKCACPACCGTGMQEVSDDCYKPCRKYVPYYPWTPYIPCTPQPWYSQPTTIWCGTGTSQSSSAGFGQTTNYTSKSI